MGVVVVEQLGERLRPAVDVARGDDPAHPPRLDEVGEHVAPGHDHRSPARDVVEQPRAEGEPRLERVAMRADPDVRLGKPGEAFVVGNPRSVEEDRAALEPELGSERDGLISHRHLADRTAWMLLPEEEQLDVVPRLREPPDSPNHGQRVEPVPDAATPEQHPIARSDPGQHALHRSA